MLQDFSPDGPLPCDDERIVERMDERQAGLRDHQIAMGLRIGVAVADQHHIRPHRPHGVDLDLRRGLRHDDRRLQTELAGRVGDTLRMIAGAGCDDAARPFVLAQMRDLVVGAPKLEAENGLQVFALEEHLVRQPARQTRGGIERGLPSYVVHAALENVVEQLIEHGRACTADPPKFTRSLRRAGSNADPKRAETREWP